jgi:hypothetical protein
MPKMAQKIVERALPRGIDTVDEHLPLDFGKYPFILI